MKDPFHAFRGKKLGEIKVMLMMLTAGKDASSHPHIVLFSREYQQPMFDPNGDIALRGQPHFRNGQYAGHWWNIDECAGQIQNAMNATPAGAAELA